jgi:hypothetical protein
MHDGVTSYEVLQFLHVFLFVFWLGPDVAVYAWSRKAVEAGASAEQRIVAGEMMVLVDHSTVCDQSMLTVVAWYVGSRPWQMAALCCRPVWLTLVLIDRPHGTPFITAQRRRRRCAGC